VALCPTAIEVVVPPLTTVKPVPEIVAWEMLTVAVPVFVRVTLCVALVPAATLPKLTVVEPADSAPEPAAPAPEVDVLDVEPAV